MSLIPVTLSNATDTFVMQTRPVLNFADGTLLRMSAASSAVMYSYIYFSRPFPLGSTITSAVLHIRQRDTLTGTRSVTAKRTLQSWKVSRITYSNQPTIDTVVAATVSKTASTAGTSWDLDITAAMQLVSDGAAWYGLRLETSDTTPLFFSSSQASGNKPTLDVTWTDAPEAPTTLSPSGNRAVSLARPIVRMDFTDYVGNTALQAVQVQTNATNVWTAPSFDSDVVATTAPQLDLSLGYPVTMTATTTSGSTTITTPATPGWTASDVGSTITGTGIPGGATITAVASSTSATLSAAATASGSPTVTVTELFASLADGASTYWRGRVQDGAGVWSPWSQGAQFSRFTKGTLTITNPAVSPNNFVQEATPPITWTFTGRTQAAYQVILQNAAGTWLWTSGKLTSTATTVTLPAGLIHDTNTYNIVIRIWDTIQREATPNDTVYVEASRAFTYNLSATVTGVSSLTGTDLTPVPSLQLDWTRATAPDSYTVVRDGIVISSNILPGDVLVSGTAYRWTDRGADPKVSHTWTVRAVVNGVTSSVNPTVVKTLSPVGIWLTDPATGIAVQLVGSDNGTWVSGEDAEIYTPVGGTRVVRVTQALRGFEGNIVGEFLSFGTTSVATSIANMYLLKSNPGATYWLTVADMCIPVIIGNVTIAPVRGGEVRKAVSFDFWQTGDLPFVASL